MKKFLGTFILSMLIFTQAFALIIEVEPHGLCEPFEVRIDQLNSNFDYPYIVYKMGEFMTDPSDKKPVCLFSKETEGYVVLELAITNTTPFVEVDKKFEDFKQKISEMTRVVDHRNKSIKGCHYSGNYHLSFARPSKVRVLGRIYCDSQDDLDFLEKLDIEDLLTTAIQGTGFTFDIEPPVAPVISGTTIHN